MAGKASSGARRLAQSVRHGLDAEAPPEMEGYQNDAGAGEADSGPQSAFMLEHLLQWDGNLAELFQDSDAGKRKLSELGATVVREFELDKAARKDWEESATRALEAAGQKKGAEKSYPFKNAANVKYPLVTTSAMQFHARAYPNIVRGDEVVQVKVNGEDPDSNKAGRAERVADFCNDQLIYQCPEWEAGTDMLLSQLPITGSAFRKVYWDTTLNRPRFDYAPALKVVLPIDAPSIELTPRVTHILDTIYPHDYERKVASGIWLKCELRQDTTDTQKPIVFLEQCRYIDMDEDGLSEPYIVVVHKDTSQVVRIDPAFDLEDIKRKPANENGEPGKIYCIDRLLPWVEYCFLPDPEGGIYGVGFGKLLEAISETVNTLLNQMIDAGHWSNTNTGFIGAGFKTRGGTISLEPNVFKMLDGVQDVKAAIQRLDFPGPSTVSFQLVELLLGAAKDITAIKDVLAGDMPGGQHVAEGTVMALIEQGLQVFTSIYKRVYRSMRRELELQCRLNRRYLDAGTYQKFLDTRPKPLPAQNAPPAPTDPRLAIGGNNGPPMTPEDMGGPPPMQAGAPGPMNAMGGAEQPPLMGALADMQAQPPQPMAPPQGAPPMAAGPGMGAVVPFPAGQPQPPTAPLPTPDVDFNLDDMDIRPIADPTALTDMQRMAKAQFKLAFKDDPAINRVAVIKSAWKDARIPNPEEYIVERNPVMEKQMAMAEAEKNAEIADKAASAKLKDAQTQEILGQTPKVQTEVENAKRALDQKDRELNQKDIELTQNRDNHALATYKADIDAANKEIDNIHTWMKGKGDHLHKMASVGAQFAKIDAAPPETPTVTGAI